MAGLNTGRLAQARGHGRKPRPLSIYAGGEGVGGVGAGFSVVTCCDENDNQVEMTFTKTCIGPSANAGLAAGIVTGLSGERCAARFYQGDFLEFNFWIFSADFGFDQTNGGLLMGGATIEESGHPQIPFDVSFQKAKKKEESERRIGKNQDTHKLSSICFAKSKEMHPY